MSDFLDEIRARLDGIRAEGLWKREAVIASPQGGRVTVDGREVLNLCANNYLGLANHPALKAAASAAMEERGYGLASVRFICGTQDLHKALEARVASYLGLDDAILFAAAFDANGALFEPLLTDADAVVSDALNHASIIDGIRLSKARRYRYANNDMDELEARLREARDGGARHVLIATDGVFSMDGSFADLASMRLLADRYGAQLMVDDAHATGFVGEKGRGTPSRAGVRADIVTGTFGKALGGALGGFVAGPGPVIDLLRQRARPYLFSNALPPAVTGATLAALDLVEGPEGDERRSRLAANAHHWRKGLEGLGFELLPGSHPIVPVMLHDARRAQDMARGLLAQGVLATGFFYPVVPQGKARIRTQMSAALTPQDLDQALEAFDRAGRETGVLAA
ncbi:2-amino-3-ketobutyrate coenzyme A ligase [Rubellimicrobium mesophilum DSM 19309]|uniref:2-amino-3-ketobutyrate coenzyme A ligase n=1 Tax=Rubellimicrobium mesophilum DSM 19309 TaxID=442562 RepID=A0A017HKG2_9RHOB|nr:glycine C-acetyltransferase [Rubellimicrobium mesophilum]EYD74633.1 2-amino-3-ketobutyrate coenzyme A ligase [Rubellimicrobium mesophilum DSM 19309]